MRAIFTPFLLLFCLSAFAQVGSPDPGFGNNGKVVTSFGAGTYSYAYALATQADGKVVTAGFLNDGSEDNFALLRYNTNGTLDNAFGNGGKVLTDFNGGDDVAYAVSLQSDGKIVVAGYTYNGAVYRFALARYNTNGSLDNSFGSGGKVVTDFGTDDDEAFGLLIQPDGKIVAAGCSGGTAYDFALVRYNTNGSLDNSFGNGGKVITNLGAADDEAFAVLIQPDKKIVAGGLSGNGTALSFALFRYNADGTPDNTFGSGGKVTTPIKDPINVVSSLALQRDGKIVAAGYTGNSGTDAYDIALARYNSNGSLDNAFGNGGKVVTDFGATDDEAIDVELQDDEKIVVGGYSGGGSGYNFALVRYTTAGVPDVSFGGTGKVAVDFGGDDACLAIGFFGTRIYAAGGANSDVAVAALQKEPAASPLPVLFTAFTAARVNAAVQLEWRTATEPAIQSFVVERSQDGQNFVPIGSIHAAGNGSGNSYAFTDRQPLSGTNQYRLKSLHANGEGRYSQVVIVKGDDNGKLALYPNPVRETLHAQFTATGRNAVQIFDAAGRIVKSIPVSQSGTVSTSLDISDLKKGTYFLRFGSETVPFAKQ